jgi:hypothetical protein
MAVLTTAQRQQVWRGLMRYWSNERIEVAVSKTDILDAIDNTDAWIEGHQKGVLDTIGYDDALPANFKANATAVQKDELLCCVAARRVSEDFLRRLVGGVD